MKNIFKICGAAIAALFLCVGAEAAPSSITRDQYLIFASSVSGMTETGVLPSTAAGADTSDFVFSNSTMSSIAYFRTDSVNYLSAQAVASSITIPAQTFGDGQAATATLTVASFAGLSTTTATGQFTAISTQAALGVVGTGVVVISSNVSGTQIAILGPPGALNFMVGGNVAQGFSSTNTAANFAAAVNATTTNSNVTATTNASSTTVTIACVNAGTFCNSYSVTSTSPTAISTAAFSGGSNPVTVTVAGANFTAGVQFQVGASTAAMANNLAAAFNTFIGSNTTANLIVSTAPLACGLPSPCGVVFDTASVAGIIGNTYGMATSNGLAISASGAFMKGGQNSAVICVNGVCITANALVNGFAPITSNSVTATNIATAFSATAASQTVMFGAAGSVVGATATVVGTTANGYLITVSTNAVTPLVLVSSSSVTGSQIGTMSGGLASATSINSPIILLTPNSGFDATGLAVLYTTSSATGLTPLVFGTTYYVIDLVPPNQYELSLTSTGSLAGLAITITSSQTKTTQDLFSLAPLAITGTPSYQWMVSNDAVNWTPWTTTMYGQAISSATLSSYVSTGTVNTWDLGHVDYGWAGMQVIPPTTGAISLTVKTIGKGD